MATITDKLETIVTADTDAFVKNMRKAEGANASFTKSEKEAQKTLRERANAVKSFFTGPSAAAGKGFDKLADSLGLTAKQAGILGAGVGTAAVAGGLLVKTFSAASRFAGEQADKMASLSEEMRRTSNLNVFASSAEGVEALAGKVATIRAQMKAVKETRIEANPYGFGGGVLGTMKTVAANAQLSLKNAVGLGPYNNFDRENDEKDLLDKQEQLAAQQRGKLIKEAGDASARELDLTRASIAGARTLVELTRSRVEHEKELARLRELGVTDPKVYRDLDERRSLNRRALKLRGRGEYMGALTDSLVSTARPGMDQGLVRAQRAQLGVQAQFNTASQRPGGLGSKTERVEWQTRLQDAANLVRSEQLALRQRQDGVAAGKLDLANQRELVDLGQQDFQARVKRADLDVRAAELAKGQAFTIEEHVKAENQLKAAVATRVRLEAIAVTTQKRAADIAYGLASRNLDVNSTNRGDLAKRAGVNGNSLVAMHAELSLPGLSLDRQRELSLGIRGGENERRQMLQEKLYGKSPGQIQRERHGEEMEQTRRDQFDARMKKTDGLYNVSRDLSGNITGGIDYLTGERRAPRLDRSNLTPTQTALVQRARTTSPALNIPRGLQSGGLKSGGLGGVATPTVKLAGKKVGNQNDVSAGKSAISAAQATVKAINISNQYLKTMTEILPTLALSA